MGGAPIRIHRLTAQAAYAELDALADVLFDCVDGGASVSFVAPFERGDARAFFERLLPEVAAGPGGLPAPEGGAPPVGTVQLTPASPPNQPHRADIAKLLVRRDSRGRGVARMLMEAAE